MKNKKIFFTSIIVPVFLLSSYAWANFEPISNETREQIKTIMEKQKSGETLFTEEQEILNSMEVNRKEFSGSGMMMWGKWPQMWQNFWELTDEQKVQMEEIKTLMEKKKNWETLITEEQEKLTQFEINKPMNQSIQLRWNENKIWKQTNTSNKNNQKDTKKVQVNSPYKTQIDKKIKSISSQFSTSTQKVKWLQTFTQKVEKLQTEINTSSTLWESKKETYNEIIDAFLSSLQDEITQILSSEETDITTDLNNLMESLLQE